jgi:hypothetical protein
VHRLDNASVSGFLLPNCAACFDAESDCIHRQRYRLVEALITKQGVFVGYAPESHPDSWHGGRHVFYGDHHEIHIWPNAYKIYGWDMMTAVLIHEYGHCKLMDAEGQCEGVEAERKANEYGRNGVPPELVPPLYDEYRSFFLRSYETPGNWTEGQCVLELANWRAEQL